MIHGPGTEVVLLLACSGDARAQHPLSVQQEMFSPSFSLHLPLLSQRGGEAPYVLHQAYDHCVVSSLAPTAGLTLHCGPHLCSFSPSVPTHELDQQQQVTQRHWASARTIGAGLCR